jgi:GTP-binding protein Era
VKSSESDAAEETHCGYVAIVGRPNVGKSTLLNHLLRQKISITSRKPQTTRHRIIGISTNENVQCIYVDTPGLHDDFKKTLNRVMNEAVINAIKGVDAILFVVERLTWNPADDHVLQILRATKIPVVLIINKIDMVKEKHRLLPHISELKGKRDFADIVPTSALGGHNLEALEKLISNYLPVGPFLFPDDQVTDRSSRFIAAEIIREKVTRQLGDELPYEVSVEIEKFSQEGPVLHIHAVILVEKNGQKQILIGKAGDRLKKIGSAARPNMEKAFDSKVMLNLWVKVKAGWADDERALKSLGYIE